MSVCALALGCAAQEPFCPSQVICDGPDCQPDTSSCIDFDEAAELARNPYSGVKILTVITDPLNTGAAIPSAENDDATCKAGTCYVRRAGAVSIRVTGSPGQMFKNWSGCSDGTEPILKLSAITRDTQCVAHLVPYYLTAHASTRGWYRSHVQITSSEGCNATDSCVTRYGGSFTFVAPSSPSYQFLGWSGCSDAKELAVTLENLVESPPECVAQYRVIASSVSWSAVGPGSVRATATGPDFVCDDHHCDVPLHERLTLEATADEGATFQAWSCATTTDTTLTIEDITQARSCQAFFEPAP